MAVDIVILAAGKGTRMRSAVPKVLHQLAGKPLLEHVLDAAKTVPNSEITVVIGHGSEVVQDNFKNHKIQWVIQDKQLGTGHAVQQALPRLRSDAVTLVLYGDVPLIAPQTLAALVSHVNNNTLALLTVSLDNPGGYGRILRDNDGHVTGIVEQKDATELQKGITEVNTGVMAIPAGKLDNWLHRIDNQNAQQEYYLTDLIAIAREQGVSIHTHQPLSVQETDGVNSRAQLHALERYHQHKIAQKLMAEGVTIADSRRFDCRGTLQAGEDCFIDINCLFVGEVILGKNVTIAANCIISNAILGDHVNIKPNTVIEGPVDIANNVDVGPFARLRPGTSLQENAKIGNFVETKKTTVGKGSKVNHLSYIGDTHIGDSVNVGAGTITCNYDGVNKFQTILKDGAFIGSNSALVAPVTIGKNATVAAGSIITSDVDDGSLAVARGKQKKIQGWKRPKKIKKD